MDIKIDTSKKKQIVLPFLLEKKPKRLKILNLFKIFNLYAPKNLDLL